MVVHLPDVFWVFMLYVYTSKSVGLVPSVGQTQKKLKELGFGGGYLPIFNFNVEVEDGYLIFFRIGL